MRFLLLSIKCLAAGPSFRPLPSIWISNHCTQYRQNSAKFPCKITPWNSMEFHGVSMDDPWNSMEFHGVPWRVHGISWRFHGVPWSSMEAPWNCMDFHGTSLELHGRINIPCKVIMDGQGQFHKNHRKLMSITY